MSLDGGLDVMAEVMKDEVTVLSAFALEKLNERLGPLEQAPKPPLQEWSELHGHQRVLVPDTTGGHLAEEDREQQGVNSDASPPGALSLPFLRVCLRNVMR